MTHDEKRKIYAALTAPFDGDAVERTQGRVTGKGYDTTGIKYAFIVARLNEVLGIGGFRTLQTTTVREGSTSKGRAEFLGTCELDMQLGEWIDGTFKPFAEAHATGGHQSVNEADARKGAFTNALKKAAAMLGCGKQAFEGTIDDDNLPAERPNRTAQNERTYRLNPVVRPDEPWASAPWSPTPKAAAPVRQPPATQAVSPPARPQPEPRAVAAPVEKAAPVNEPVSSPVSPQPTGNGRNRLTSKQLSALWALARRVGYEQTTFRRKVHERYGVQPEYLDRDTASTVIGQLTAMASQQVGSGASHPVANGATYQ